ncbi:MAG: molybdopterin oxidoreductase, partial [Alphaproteobacteria bacterium]|nr:molybdopterin oxidoreductase [Alphaproteobacteria bacterium]
MTHRPDVWHGLDAHGNPAWARLEAEFPALAAAIGETSRRDVLRVMAASLALAVTGCGREAADDAIPYVEQPEDQVPGVPRVYASAVTLGGIAQPILATTHDGRPTKLEGNPDHPASGGATDVFTQAAVLDLYDPDRAQAPTLDGRPASWAEVETALSAQRRSWHARRGAGVRLLIGATSSPTLIRQLGLLLAQLPEARIHVFEPIGAERRYAGTQLAFGRPLERHHRIEAARAIVSLEDDWLGPGPRQTSSIRAWVAGRAQPERRPRLWVAESTPSLTGAAAAHRLPIAAARVPAL